MWPCDIKKKKKKINSSNKKFMNHVSCYSSLSDIQKASILATMGAFETIFFFENTIQRDSVNELFKQREKMLNMSYEQAKLIISDADALIKGLTSIGKSPQTDILLNDMKFMFHQLVSLMIIYKNGAEVNQKALNTLYGIFLPLGYEKLEIHNPNDYMIP